MPYTEQHFQKAKEFLDFFLQDRRFEPRNIFHAMWRGLNGFIFRGQVDSKWRLVPKAHRSKNLLAGFTPQTPGTKRPKKDKRIEYLGWQLQAELRAVYLFLDYADRVGISTPVDYGLLGTRVDVIHAALNGENFDYSQPFPSEVFLPSIALAQHHGVPLCWNW